VSCHEFVQRDMDVRGLGFALGVTPYDDAPDRLVFAPVFDLPAAVCGSGDSFATADIEADCAVVDMEAYALAKVCWCEKARFACVKYVTDGADTGAAGDWQSNVHKAAEEFLRLYRSLA
jgi:adenosylhomocysteine nucleosidase